ncbi:ubiquitin carboxyl-terminal hydrolase 19-like isoform X2 [Ostrea edulis]|uniref:ubiquitin carboxyl-terminal hydrolase 19-like isoform X2 n=1 Tax=Ostrea edulis TaxID=37623 RepID=UPI0024AF980A|nr:ubiquitin carboxyl-terminal hydrolase 19-like isoform X2 [Ostrea edulis]
MTTELADDVPDIPSNKDFSTLQTNFALSPKRKKDSENDFETDWKQSNEEIEVNIKLDFLSMGVKEPKDIDVTFSDSDVVIGFAGGKKWTCDFCHPVAGEKCKVQVKKHKIILKVKKKEPRIWKDLTAAPSTASRSEFSCESPDSPSSSPSFSSEMFDPLHSVTAMSANSRPEDTDIGSKTGDKEGEKDEPVYELNHIKHDYFEKDFQFTLYVYVKELKKDYVKVICKPKSLTIQFKTLDQKFLQLHQGTTDETTFVWKVNLKGEIQPDKCVHRVTGAMLEMKMWKVKQEKWNSLEASQHKVAEATATKSDGWISTGKSKLPTTSASTSKMDSPTKGSVAFDELADVNLTRKSDLKGDNKSASELGATGISRDTYGQKPTCKVSPMNKNLMDLCVRPGMTGMDNLGNTCFMNSVLQALSNTTEFRDFFLDSGFQNDINTDNPLGMGGKLAVSYAVLLRMLWSGKHYSYAPSKLKSLVAQKASQFNGFAQHDAQEFMAFFLDGLHEDLNRIKKKPYTETVDSDGRLDEVVADEAWEMYKKRNDSFIVDLFQGQYKSKLTCPVCGKISITFDPFLYLSLPLPKKKRLLPVIFMWKEPYKKPLRLVLRLPKDCTTEALKEETAKKTGVKPSAMRVFEAYKGKIYKFYGKGTDLSAVQSNDTIIISEVLTEDIAGEPVYEIYVIQRTIMPNQIPSRCSSCRRLCPDGAKLKRCTKCFKVGYCDHTCQKNHWVMHKNHCNLTPEAVGSPFIVSIPESRATFSRLSTLMEAYARYSVDVFQPPVKTEPKIHSSGMSSSSSQSSGSINSLDSQSSCSSSCTITAEQGPTEDKVDFFIGETNISLDLNESNTSTENSFSNLHMGNVSDGSSTSIGAQAGSISSLDSTGSGSLSSPIAGDVDLVTEQRESPEEEGDPGNQPESVSFKTPNLPEFSSFKMPKTNEQDQFGKSSSDNETEMEKSKTVPTKQVLGIKSDEIERTKPLFYLKPVNQDGVGIRGPEGERVEDLGDEPIDLTYRQFLSIDWKNHEKFDSYVLVQTKDMEYEEDPTLTSQYSEETGNINIQQCLDLFTEPEILNPEEAWYCPSCKEHREATKQMSIWRLPHTLIIQLKRFSFRNFIWRDKIDKMVEFPVRGLDLSPYTKTGANESPPIYDLYGVVNHYGGILGGHYTSFVRTPDAKDPTKNEMDWRLCDDSRVSFIGGEKNVVVRGAYLLFYRKREPLESPMLMSPELDIGDQNGNAGFMSLKTKSDENETEKEPCYMKDENLIEDEVVTSSLHSTEPDDFGDGSGMDNLPLLVDHRYQRMYGVSGEDEVDKDSPYSQSRPSPTEDLGYTDMEAVD